jgi:hypothetical protein
VLRQADQRVGSARSTAGATWTFPEAKRVTIDGPEGPVAVSSAPSDEACAERGANPGCGDTALRAVVGIRGRYAVRVDGDPETRVVTLDAAEILAEPRTAPPAQAAFSSRGAAEIGISREIALFLIAVFALELGVRLFRTWTGRRQGAAARAT